MKFKINESNIDSEFTRIAELLLWEYELVVNNEKFNFTEIEFYYYSKNHQDAFTHKHKEDAGNWRFHNQGFDITLKGETGFGGILIRGVESKGTFINGPRRVLFEIMSHLNPVSELNNIIGLEQKKETKSKIFKTFRHGLNNPNAKLPCNDREYFRNANYRFLVNPQSFDKNQFQGSEIIAKRFNNAEMSHEFLGYNLRQ